MKKQRILLVAFAVCVLGVVANAQLLKRTTTKSDAIPFGAGSTLSITGAPVGDIKVSNSTTDKITVEATIEVQASNEADLAGAAALTGFIVQETLGRVSIVSVGADLRRKFTNEEKKLVKRLKGMPYRIDYSIGIPRYCNVEIDGGHGIIDLSGAEGQHRINGVESELRVQVYGRLSINLVHGRADITVVPGHRLDWIEASVASGQLGLHMVRGVSADIEASILRSGHVSIKDAPDLKPRDERKFPYTEKLVMARSGVGGPVIKLTVGDGDVWVGRVVE
ncbi:MAG TPA: hypothetical protein VL501_02095 [Pyrinomonadaceae bacterium]|nr:hypothetical protein [Pyrinomonadaceae bacterium]